MCVGVGCLECGGGWVCGMRGVGEGGGWVCRRVCVEGCVGSVMQSDQVVCGVVGCGEM